MLEVVKFLRFYSLEALVSKFNIFVSRHSKYPNLVHLKYNQIESPMDTKIVQECRGLILDESDKWNVVAFPYTKFFNHGEHLAAQIDWATASIQEKLDGSIITMNRYDKQWHISTSGTADGTGEVGFNQINFADLFWNVWKELGYNLPGEEYNDYCFMFELLTPLNRVVVPQLKRRIVLHGVRNIKNLLEFSPQSVSHLGWEIVKTFKFDTLDNVVKASQELDPLQTEGYVVCDGNFNRLKVKGPKYVAIHHLKSSASPKNMLDLIRIGENNEFLVYFPEFTDKFYEIEHRYNKFIDNMLLVYEKSKHIESQKDFAITIKSQLDPLSCGILFNLRKRGGSVREMLKTVVLNNLAEAVKLEEIQWLQ